jgi:hypothetical protein
MIIPEGNHTIELKFEPAKYYMSNTVTLASSILFTLLVLGMAVGYIHRKRSGSPVAKKE